MEQDSSKILDNSEVKVKSTDEMMTEILKLTTESHEMLAKIKRYMAIRAVVGVLYIVLILAPIIFAITYLPPLLNDWLGQYSEQELSGGGWRDLLQLAK